MSPTYKQVESFKVKATDCSSNIHIRFVTIMDKENIAAIANTTLLNMNPSCELSQLVNVGNVEDFSFQKLRGNLMHFEKTQRDHYNSHTHLKDVVNVMTSNNFPTSTMTLQEPHHHAKVILMKTPNQKQSVNHLNKEQQPNITLSPVPAKDDDFTFEKLRKRALKLEEKNPVIGPGNKQVNTKKSDEDVEDFSFQKLKQKALDIEKNGVETPIRNKHKNVHSVNSANCNTPSRTPAKRSVPTTPQTNASYKNRTSNTTTPITCTHKTTSAVIHGPPALRVTPHLPSTKPNSTSFPSRSATTNVTFNPHRYKFGPTVKKEEVEATDNSMASVQKLSQWLSDDPFQKKKQITIRKSEQVAHKSRAFESDEVLKTLVGGKNKKETRVEREKEHFPAGKVSQGKNWLAPGG